MIIQPGTLVSRGQTSIADFDIEGYKVAAFQGSLSPNDILVKYKTPDSRLRTPKHVHWAVDILMKIQGDRELTRVFLSELQSIWDNSASLHSNDFETLKNLVETSMQDLDRFNSLNDYGEYNVAFLYVLMVLLSAQEKTNNPDAYMFGKVITGLLEEQLDIFKVISAADYRGR